MVDKLCNISNHVAGFYWASLPSYEFNDVTHICKQPQWEWKLANATNQDRFAFRLVVKHSPEHHWYVLILN